MRLLVVSHPCVVAANQAVYLELRRAGWEVTIVVPRRWEHDYRSGRFGPDVLPGMEGTLLPLPVALVGRIQRHFYLARADVVLRDVRPDVVFIEEEPFSAAGLQWGRASTARGIPWGIHSDENLNRELPAPVVAARTYLLRRAAFVAARSPATRDLVARWGATGDVVVLPHAVPEWPVPATVREHFTVGYAGRLVPEKGVADLVAAVRRMRSPARLVLFGDGPERDSLARGGPGANAGANAGVNAGANGPEVRVVSDMPHERMNEAFAQMDVLVLPSRSTPTWTEQFGRVLVEALWCGVPVVGSDSGAIPWVVDSTGGGRIFPEGDVDALAGVLDELAGDPVLRATLARKGRASVEERFGVRAVSSRLADALSAAR